MEKDLEDLLLAEYPPKTERKRMDLGQWAKIFLPFEALNGFEEAIEEMRRLSEIASEPKYTKLED